MARRKETSRCFMWKLPELWGCCRNLHHGGAAASRKLVTALNLGGVEKEI